MSFALRLLWDEDGDDVPSANWSLPTFFERWFVPNVLLDPQRVERRRPAKESTIDNYRASVAWWKALATTDPDGLSPPAIYHLNAGPGREIVARFQDSMEKATFKRAREVGAYYELSPSRRFGVERDIRAVLYRLGPPADHKRPNTASLIQLPPHLRIEKPHADPWPPYAVVDARAILGAVHAATWPARWWKRKPHFTPEAGAPDNWRARYFGLYYTGLRLFHLKQLTWDMVIDEGGKQWFRLPWLQGNKQSPPRKFIHPDLYAAMLAVRTSRTEVFWWPYSSTYMDDQHTRIQTAAGLPEDRRQSLDAWRRTHVTEMGRTGAMLGVQLAQHSAWHTTPVITRNHYLTIEPDLINAMPRLVA